MPILVALALAPFLGTVLAWIIWGTIIIWLIQQWWVWATLISIVLWFAVWAFGGGIRFVRRNRMAFLVGIVACVFGVSYLLNKYWLSTQH